MMVKAGFFAHGIDGQHLDSTFLSQVKHAVHDFRRLAIRLPTRAFPVRQRAGQIDGELLDIDDVQTPLPQARFFQREAQHRRETARRHEDGLAGRQN